MFDSNKDRGKIKWTAMMLPEHIEKLRTWHASDSQVPQPVLEEFELQDIQDLLASALLKKLYDPDQRLDEQYD